MRMILAYLAIANLRWADADLARARFLRGEIDAAQDRAAVRLALARRFAGRAHLAR